MDVCDFTLRVSRPTSAAGTLPRQGTEHRASRNANTPSTPLVSASKYNAATNPMFKTGRCWNFWFNGTCRYGDKCIFAHVPKDLRDSNMMNQNTLKSGICRYSWDKCPYGANCFFLHRSSKTYEVKRDKSRNKYAISIRSGGVDSKGKKGAYNKQKVLNSCDSDSKCNYAAGQAESRSSAPIFASESAGYARLANKWKRNKPIVGIYADWINEKSFAQFMVDEHI